MRVCCHESSEEGFHKSELDLALRLRGSSDWVAIQKRLRSKTGLDRAAFRANRGSGLAVDGPPAQARLTAMHMGHILGLIKLATVYFCAHTQCNGQAQYNTAVSSHRLKSDIKPLISEFYRTLSSTISLTVATTSGDIASRFSDSARLDFE